MRVTTPWALLLLLVLPYFIWLGRAPAPRRPWRERASLAVRLLIVCLIVLALAGTQAVRAADELAVVFLVDASDSMKSGQLAEAEAFVRQAIEGMGANDQAAVVLFGANALVERPMSGLAELAPITSVPASLHTNLAEAIRLGLALFPAGSARRLVLLSDGAATVGDAREAARVAAASGVPIDVVPLPQPEGVAEALVTSVSAPGRIVQGETFRIDVTVESTGNMPATLRLLSGGTIAHEELVQLRPGSNRFSLRLRGTEQEFARYTVQLAPRADTFYQNNQMAAFTEVTGPPRLLMVAASDGLDDAGKPVVDESPPLRLALEAAGLQVTRVTPGEMPANLADLSNYAGIILVDVNAKNLSPRKMAALQTYVRDLGGGLVAVGGPQSYGMGGYFHTPLEETLPVEMQIKDQERFPSVSIALVIDRSGSMGAEEGGVVKIQLAAEGAVRVVELLNDFDEISVFPVDTQPDNPIGPASLADREDIINAIRQLGAGGGGIYVRTGLEAAAAALAESRNQVKHIIVLADGSDSEQKEGVPELLDALTAQEITISFVAIGEGPDVPWLQQMAERGHGRFHFTDRAANLPQIFTQETTSIQRSYLIEERFFPSLVGRSPILQGIASVPPLYGYVGTSPKETAQVILETHQGDPLLASWQYGLGRAVAWTSDATGRWGVEWVRWPGFPAFWAQAVRWSMSPERGRNLETVVSLQGQKATLTSDARDEEGHYLNNLLLTANVVWPDGRTETVALPQVAPGRYEGTFVPAEEGAYFLGLAGRSASDGEVVVAQSTGWVLGYAPEYRLLATDETLLPDVARLSGGRVFKELSTATVQAIFRHDLEGEAVVRPIWNWLLLAAVLLLPLDISLRRLVITRRDWARAWAATLGRWQPPRAMPAPRPVPMARLFQAKSRAGTRPEQDTAPSSAAPLSPPQASSTPPEALPAESVTSPPSPPSSAEGTLASRLLQRKRAQQSPPEEEP